MREFIVVQGDVTLRCEELNQREDTTNCKSHNFSALLDEIATGKPPVPRYSRSDPAVIQLHGEPEAHFPGNGTLEDLMGDLARVQHRSGGHEVHKGVSVDAFQRGSCGVEDGLLGFFILVLGEGEPGLKGVQGAEGEEVDGAAEGAHHAINSKSWVGRRQRY